MVKKDMVVMDEKKRQAIEYMVKGENISTIAELVGVTRATLYNWMENKEFKAELDKRIHEFRNQIDKKLLVNVEPLLDKLIKIALKSKSDKTSLDACIYALNRLVGTPTSKVQDVTEDTDKTKETIDLDIVKDKVDKVIDIAGVKDKKAE